MARRRMWASGLLWMRVVFAGLVSSLVVLAQPLAAHEVVPAIADMTQAGDRLEFSVKLNLEAILAGVDQSTVADTNDAPQAADYDRLRAMEPSDLQAAFEAAWPNIAAGISILGPSGPLPPTVPLLTVPEVGDIDIVRQSTLAFGADLPAGAESVTIGWDAAFGTLVLRQQGVEEPYTGYLETGAISDPIQLTGGGEAGLWQTFFGYMPIGFDHIVPKGLDHILFVLGLFFLSTRLRPLLMQVSAFTLAHTLTLALAALGYVSVPSTIVEPLIAASIVFVAVENILLRGLSPWRPIVVFGFGLLHGLGFASVLGQFGLPEGAFVPALIGFNIGVEGGQLFVIATAALCVWGAVRATRAQGSGAGGQWIYGGLTLVAASLALVAPGRGWHWDDVAAAVFLWPLAGLFALCGLAVFARNQTDAFRRIVATPASVAIAVVGGYWFVERVFL